MALWTAKGSQVSKATDLSVHTFDLKSAYKQIGLHRDGRETACVAVFCPDKKISCFFQFRFGSTRSVRAFLRLAKSVWWLSVQFLHIVWTNFYDDFIVLSDPQLESNTGNAVASLLKLLGCVFATAGKKAAPFGTSCRALGIKFDLTQSRAGIAELVNTEERSVSCVRCSTT